MIEGVYRGFRVAAHAHIGFVSWDPKIGFTGLLLRNVKLSYHNMGIVNEKVSSLQ